MASTNNMLTEVAPDTAAVKRARQYALAALPAWALEGAELELIKHRENTVYKLQAADGKAYALRVHRSGYHTAAEITAEMNWMRALSAEGIATAQPVASARGEWVESTVLGDGAPPRLCSLFAWHEGELFDNLGVEEQGMLPTMQSRYRQLGALAARVHRHGEHWQAPPGFTRHSWDADGLLGAEPLWGRFWEHPLLSPAQRRLVLKARIALAGLLQQLGQGSDCYGLIHADFLPENILVHDGELRLIDFDDCGYGWYMFEMATSVFPKITEPYFDQLVDAYVQGYRSERDFSDEHLEIFPAFILLRGLTYLGWLMNRAEGMVNRDLIAQQIIDGLCEHIPELLDALSPLQRVGVNCMAWWQARTLA